MCIIIFKTRTVTPLGCRQRTTLMKNISSYKPSCTEEARVLLLGPVGSGKSSFISSVQSVFNGRVTNRAMVGSFSTSFTKKVHEKIERQTRGEVSALTVVDGPSCSSTKSAAWEDSSQTDWCCVTPWVWGTAPWQDRPSMTSCLSFKVMYPRDMR